MLNGSPIRTVLYGRTSLDRSEGKSVDDQLSDLHRWAVQTGRQIVCEERDDGISASRFARGKTRPGWQRVMELIACGAVDELAVWEVSRNTRDRMVWAALIASCIDHDVNMAVDGKVHDPSDPDDGFMLDLGAALAVRESAMTAKRTRRAVRSRAAAGRPHGRLTYGYRRVLDPVTGKAVGREIHPEHAAIVREIVERLLRRESARSIALDLNDRGVPSPQDGKWVTTNVSVLARRPAYAGLRQFRGKVLPDVKATWPPIVTEAEYHQLVQMYADPARDKYRNPERVKYLGSGIFRCGREGCTGKMRVLRYHKAPSYSCTGCYRCSRKMEPVDAMVNAAMWRWLSRPDALTMMVDADDTQAQAASAEAARLEMKLREARQAWEDDQLSTSGYTDMEARLLPKIRAAQEHARPLSAPPALLELAGSGERAEKKWFDLPIGERRACVAWSLDVVILPVGHTGAGQFDPDGVRITPRWGPDRSPLPTT